MLSHPGNANQLWWPLVIQSRGRVAPSWFDVDIRLEDSIKMLTPAAEICGVTTEKRVPPRARSGHIPDRVPPLPVLHCAR